MSKYIYIRIPIHNKANSEVVLYVILIQIFYKVPEGIPKNYIVVFTDVDESKSNVTLKSVGLEINILFRFSGKTGEVTNSCYFMFPAIFILYLLRFFYDSNEGKES